jgi:hypothetical protein
MREESEASSEPEGVNTDASAVRIRAASSVYGRTVRSERSTENTPMRSPGAFESSTYFDAALVARIRASGESRSNTNARNPGSSSGSDTFDSTGNLGSGAARGATSANPTALDTRRKDPMACCTPSSYSSKSSAPSVVTGRPRLSRTTTSTSTAVVVIERRDSGATC